jgi:hypothetical protein
MDENISFAPFWAQNSFKSPYNAMFHNFAFEQMLKELVEMTPGEQEVRTVWSNLLHQFFPLFLNYTIITKESIWGPNKYSVQYVIEVHDDLDRLLFDGKWRLAMLCVAPKPNEDFDEQWNYSQEALEEVLTRSDKVDDYHYAALAMGTYIRFYFWTDKNGFIDLQSLRKRYDLRDEHDRILIGDMFEKTKLDNAATFDPHE